MYGTKTLAHLSIFCITWVSIVRGDRYYPNSSLILIRNKTTGAQPLCAGVVIDGNFGLTVATCFPERKYDRPYNGSDLVISTVVMEPNSDGIMESHMWAVGLLYGHPEFERLGQSNHWKNNVVLLMLLARDNFIGAVDPYIQKYGDYLKAESWTIINSERCNVMGVVESDEESVFHEPAITFVDYDCDEYCSSDNIHLCSGNGYYVRLLVNQSVRLLPGAVFICPDRVVSVINTEVTCHPNPYIGELTAPLAIYQILQANLAIEDSANGNVTIGIEDDGHELVDFVTHGLSVSSQVISEKMAVLIVVLTELLPIVCNKVCV